MCKGVAVLVSLHLAFHLVAGQNASPAEGPGMSSSASAAPESARLIAGLPSLLNSTGVLRGSLQGEVSTVNISEPDADKSILQPLQTANQPPTPPGPDIVLAALAPTTAAVPGVQWQLYLPDGIVESWPEVQSAYIENVAFAAGVPDDWVTILEAPNTSFTLVTQVAYQNSTVDSSAEADQLATEIAQRSSAVLASLRLMGPVVVQQVSRLPVAADARGGGSSGRGLRDQFWVHAKARQSLPPRHVLGVALVAVTGGTAFLGSMAIGMIVWHRRRTSGTLSHVSSARSSSAASELLRVSQDEEAANHNNSTMQQM